jgi:thymidylate synthase ThyX
MIKVVPVLASMNTLTGTAVYTMLATYPRSIHAQLLTHRTKSKNSSSSRAIPTLTEIQNIKNNPVQIMWSRNGKGMQGELIEDLNEIQELDELVLDFRKAAFKFVKGLADPKGHNVHKQNINRFLEPFANITVLISATEWDNFDWLRIDGAAQHEIAVLAKELKECRENMVPMPIYAGEYHTPFVDRVRDEDGKLRYYSMESHIELTLEGAIKVSSSCAAQTSYRRLDDSLEKADDMEAKLKSGYKLHASPFEHVCTPIQLPMNELSRLPLAAFMQQLPEGITHVSRDLSLWSGNFRNWIQYRHLMPNNDKALFKD